MTYCYDKGMFAGKCNNVANLYSEMVGSMQRLSSCCQTTRWPCSRLQVSTCLFGVLLTMASTGWSLAAAPQQAKAFLLKDQYGAQHTYDFPHRKISVLFFADYAGSAQLKAWIQPLYDHYQDTIAIYGVADLAVVPKGFYGLVALALRKQVQYPVMLDWDGTVSKAYEAQPGQANIFVIDPQGYKVLTLLGAITEAKFHRLVSQINRLMHAQADSLQ